MVRNKRASIIAVAALLLLAGCAAPAEQAAEADDALECVVDGRSFVVSDPWGCLRQGGRLVEASIRASGWVAEAVKVNWQGRDDITSGRLFYSRFGQEGEILLSMPEAGDSCRGPYRLYSFGDAQWSAACDSGQKIRGIVFMNEGGVSVSGHGKDGEGRIFGFYPQQG